MCDTKKCGVCKEEKPLTEFHKSKNRKDGLDFACKTCRSKARREATQSKHIPTVIEDLVGREFFII